MRAENVTQRLYFTLRTGLEHGVSTGWVHGWVGWGGTPGDDSSFKREVPTVNRVHCTSGRSSTASVCLRAVP